jgi:alkylhydroperoxidase family enzyme
VDGAQTTLTGLLAADAVPMDVLHQRYGSLLELVRKLIGVVPNCDPYLEIWPPGFRSYNVMVPNLLNLPFSLWGFGAPAPVVGLAMYASSRAAECAYCSAHTCSFALRRGAAPVRVARALDVDAGSHTPAEGAAIAVARSLSRVPCALTAAEREELARHYSAGDVEWIVLSICMMGFLNKFMDAIGVELEGSTVDEVRALIGPSGWAVGKHGSDGNDGSGSGGDGGGNVPRGDTLATKLGIIRFIPSALSLDRRWTGDAPRRWPAVGEYLRARTGHDFPVLSRLRHARAIRAIAVMVRDNLDPATTVLGLPAKWLAGLVYATVVGDRSLCDEVRTLSAHAGVAPALCDDVIRFAAGGDAPASADGRTRAALALARAVSPSPAALSPAVVDECRAAPLEPAAIVELVVWLSVLQLLHRLSAFYAASP